MAPIKVTTAQRLYELRQSCYSSGFVSHVEEQLVDIDILKVRVHLIIGSVFIDVFHNVVTDKTSFALVEADQRLYGADNAKIEWHKHPFSAPDQHIPCQPIKFAEFLVEVENYFRVTKNISF